MKRPQHVKEVEPLCSIMVALVSGRLREAAVAVGGLILGVLVSRHRLLLSWMSWRFSQLEGELSVG